LRRQIILFRGVFPTILRSKIVENTPLKKKNFAAVGGKINFYTTSVFLRNLQ